MHFTPVSNLTLQKWEGHAELYAYLQTIPREKSILGGTRRDARRIIRKYSVDHTLVTVIFYHKPNFQSVA